MENQIDTLNSSEKTPPSELEGTGLREDGHESNLNSSAGRKSTFEAKRERRIERLRERADRKKQEGDRRLAQADSIAFFIPPGQPILVGHHSERRHRRDLERINGHTRKGFEALKASERLEQRAISAEENLAIFSDDPAAGEKLEAKIARLESRQSLMREVNRFIRSKKSLSALGFSEAAEAKLKTPDFLGRIGYADYELKNNGANIRRLKARLESLRREEARPIPEDVEKNGIRLVENADENRVQIFFPGKPADEVRERLKRDGFRWSRFNGCWQRHRSPYASQLARRFLDVGDKLATGSA